MLRCTVLASGSKGNCTVVSTGSTRILLDAGLSCREIVKRMRFAGEDPDKIDGLLITHEHSDHIQGVGVLARRWRVPVYFTEATHRAWSRIVMPRKTMSFAAWLETRKLETRKEQTQREQAAAEAAGAVGVEAPSIAEASSIAETLTSSRAQVEDQTEAGQFPCDAAVLNIATDIAAGAAVEDEAEMGIGEAEGLAAPKLLPEAGGGNPAHLPALEYFRAGVSFTIGDIAITPFTIPHDAADPVGFVLEAEGMRIAVATDLGYMPPNVQMHLLRADLLILESNHDVEMLRDGPYPWAVKQRVLSRVGHLSNDAAGEFLANTYDGFARWIVLAHLSESNNLPELARLTAERALLGRGSLSGNQVLLAQQQVPLEPIYL